MIPDAAQTTLPAYAATTPPPAPQTQPRAGPPPVDRAEGGRTHPDRHTSRYSVESALLDLVSASAEDFKRVIELTGDATAAGTMEGFVVSPPVVDEGEGVDLYA